MVMNMLDKLEASAKAASCISYLTSVGLVTGSIWEFLNTNAAGFGVILGFMTFLMNAYFKVKASKIRENTHHRYRD